MLLYSILNPDLLIDGSVSFVQEKRLASWTVTAWIPEAEWNKIAIRNIAPPQGYTPVSASALYPGVVINATLITYPLTSTVNTSIYFNLSGSTPPTPAVIKRSYYQFSGRRLALRVSGSPVASENGVFFFMNDHLGGSNVTLKYVTGGLSKVGELRYKAWGESRAADYLDTSTPTDLRFTGQRLYEGLGLYHYGARVYDPALGRFLSPDTVIPGQDAAAWDRYAYALENPVRYNDPTGHSVDCGIGDPYCRAGKVDTSSRALSVATNRTYRDRLDKITYYWDGLSSLERAILSEGGWSRGDYNEFAIGGNASYADLGHDPATYAVLVFTGYRLLYGILPGAETAGATISSVIQNGVTGKAGEIGAGIIKNTKHIPSLTNTAKYRIPDQLLFDEGLLSEVKNVAYLSLTNQIRDFLLYAQLKGMRFELWVRSNTTLSTPLQELIDAGEINLRKLPW